MGCAEQVGFEGSTAVFARRRYRDKWNRTVVRRVSKKHAHSLKIKAKVRARGVRSQQWYSEQRVQYLRKKCRAQNLWNLHLAGDWHYTMETVARGPKPHLMRVMLISNIAVDSENTKVLASFLCLLRKLFSENVFAITDDSDNSRPFGMRTPPRL